MRYHQMMIVSALLATASCLALQAPASAAKLHLLNCTPNLIAAKTYNSYDDPHTGIAATQKNIGPKGTENGSDKATLACATEQCILTLEGKERGKHHSSHHYITDGLTLSQGVSEANWVCP